MNTGGIFCLVSDRVSLYFEGKSWLFPQDRLEDVAWLWAEKMKSALDWFLYGIIHI